MRPARSRNVAEEYLLDTSAMIAYLEDEEGADRVEESRRAAREVDRLQTHFAASDGAWQSLSIAQNVAMCRRASSAIVDEQEVASS